MNDADKIRVLVVDDDKSSRAVVMKYLQTHGFEVHEAGSGHKALTMIKARPFTVVISDISMPDGDGLELLTEVKNLDKKIKVFLMSVSPELYIENKGFDLANAVFKKPVNLTELLRAVEAASGQGTIGLPQVA